MKLYTQLSATSSMNHNKFFRHFFILAILYNLVMTGLYLNVPIHQEQALRQTQTALTTY